METALITTSRLRAFNACRRLHYYRYVLGYRPAQDKPAPEFGTIMHAGLEAWWLAWGEGRELLALGEAQDAIAKAAASASFFDEPTAVKADLLMLGYHARWAPSMGDYEVLGVEQQFAAALPTPAGAKRCRGLKVAGKLDALVRRRSDGLAWIVEHKVTSADLTPGSVYFQRLRMDTQVSVYFEGAAILGHPPAGCLYDILSKPEQRPLKATPLEKRKYKKDKKGNPTDELYANQRAADESMADFRARLVAEIAGQPEAYFQRVEVVRLEHELEESRVDMYQTGRMIRETNNAGYYPRNADACFSFNRPCEFLDVCNSSATLDDETRFRKLASVHPELANDNDQKVA
jgi:hypothetical protein